MKVFMLLVFVLISLPSFAHQDEMRQLINATNGSIYNGHVPRGYRSVKLSSVVETADLKKFMKNVTKQKKKDWSEYVLTSGEYDHETLAERRRIAANPLKTLDVKALLEIEEVYAIYKGNQLIGYFVQITDHVQGAIYQDGACYEVFFDSQFILVEQFDRSA